MKGIFLSLSCCLLLFSCTIEPQPINYGTDQCHSCKMSIVDKAHASELVTKKGRAQKFDAIECMVHYLSNNPEQQNAYVLVSDFDDPGKFIDAEKAIFLVSEQIPSPMGAFLSAFSSPKNIESLSPKVTGNQYNWEQIQSEL